MSRLSPLYRVGNELKEMPNCRGLVCVDDTLEQSAFNGYISMSSWSRNVSTLSQAGLQAPDKSRKAASEDIRAGSVPPYQH